MFFYFNNRVLNAISASLDSINIIINFIFNQLNYGCITIFLLNVGINIKIILKNHELGGCQFSPSASSIAYWRVVWHVSYSVEFRSMLYIILYFKGFVTMIAFRFFVVSYYKYNDMCEVGVLARTVIISNRCRDTYAIWCSIYDICWCIFINSLSLFVIADRNFFPICFPHHDSVCVFFIYFFNILVLICSEYSNGWHVLFRSVVLNLFEFRFFSDRHVYIFYILA